METETITLKAVTSVAAEAGVFEAVISTATIDREKDIVEPQAMVDALLKWVPLGKKVALRWNHGTTPDHVIGHIEPESARVLNSEVAVKGWVDQDTPLGKDAWRLIKSGVLGFSFGYLIPEGGFTPREGGGKHIKAMDVYEVTAFHAVMNNDTRVIGWKSMTEVRVEEQLEAVTKRLDVLERTVAEVKSRKVEETAKEPSVRAVDPLRNRAMEAALEIMSDGLGTEPPVKQEPERKTVTDEAARELRERSRALMIEVLSGG